MQYALNNPNPLGVQQTKVILKLYTKLNPLTHLLKLIPCILLFGWSGMETVSISVRFIFLSVTPLGRFSLTSCHCNPKTRIWRRDVHWSRKIGFRALLLKAHLYFKPNTYPFSGILGIFK